MILSPKFIQSKRTFYYPRVCRISSPYGGLLFEIKPFKRDWLALEHLPLNMVRRTALAMKLKFANLLKHLIWIKRIPQPIANVIDGDDAEEDHQAGEDGEPGVLRKMFLRVAQQISP